MKIRLALINTLFNEGKNKIKLSNYSYKFLIQMIKGLILYSPVTKYNFGRRVAALKF